MRNRTQVRGSKVGVVGGSIAGCAVAIALGRMGCDVTVFERSSGALQDRGAGIAIPEALRNELIEKGYLPADYAVCRRSARRWVVGDGTHDGRILWDQPGTGILNNWSVLWRSLRAATTATYRDGVHVVAVRDEGDDAACIDFADGTTERFDVVIGADGYRSSARQTVAPKARPEYAGYVLWRGNFPESRLTDTTAWDALDDDDTWLTVCFDGGHGVMYPIPDFEETAGPGARRVNWAMYAPAQPGADFCDPSSIPPGAVDDAAYAHFRTLLDTTVPPVYRPLFASPQADLSIQPIYDLVAESYVSGRVALIGDAGAVTRPHTGSGATKAMQDALALEQLGVEHTTWDELLAAYDQDRSARGRTVVELGRRIGRDQVEETPPWIEMSPSDLEDWAAATLAGERLYFYGDVAERVAERVAT